MKTFTRNRATRRDVSADLEHLEPRSLLSAPYEFAAVGFRFDMADPRVIEMIGRIEADNSVTGTQTLAGLDAAAATGPIDWDTFQFLSQGRVTATPRDGVGPYEQQVGGSFAPDRGYAFGSFFAQFADDGPSDVSFIVQRAVSRTIDWDRSVTYEFQYLELSSDGFSMRSGIFYKDVDGIVWSDVLDGSDSSVIAIESQDAFASLHLADGRSIHVSPALNVEDPSTNPVYPPGATAIIVDADNSDGRVGIGIARTSSDNFFYDGPLGLQGVHRASILTEGPIGDAFFGASPVAEGVGSARVAISLEVTGQYHIYDLAAYDAGDRTVVSSGAWDAVGASFALRHNIVILTADSDGATAYFTLTFDLSLQAFIIENDKGDVSEHMMGLGSTFSPLAIDRVVAGAHVGLDPAGHPIFYESVITNLFADNETQDWRLLDLVAAVGGKPLVAVDSVAYRQDTQSYLILGVAEDGDVLLWERGFNSRWTYRNLSQELDAPRLVSDVAIFDYRASDVLGMRFGTTPSLAVAGKNADGEIVLYEPMMELDRYGLHPWFITNVTADGLEPFGEETPTWTGGIQGYQTSWYGVNLVGLDENGELQVVWTAPAVNHWFTTNISELAGAPRLTGSISVLLTYWDGIHIEALDENGHVHSTWWVPQLGADWDHNDLTAELEAPPLDITRNTPRTEAFTAYVGLGVGSTLNIVGFDADGRLRVYWWSPATDIWLVGDITGSIPLDETPIGFAHADALGSMDRRGDYFPQGQSLYGYNEDDTFSRVWWAANGPDTWHVENLTQVAIPIEV